MDVADPEEKTESAEHLDILAQQRGSLSASVEKFICDAATKITESNNLQKMTGPRHCGSVRSCSHQSSRHSSGTYSSKAQSRGRKGSTGSCVCGTRETTEN